VDRGVMGGIVDLGVEGEDCHTGYSSVSST
jgi:hypothetical protein